MSFQSVRGGWSLALGVGNYNNVTDILEEGIMFAIYKSGPWVGIKLPENSNIGWIGMDNVQYDLTVRTLYFRLK